MDFSLTTLYVLPNGVLAPDGFKRESLQPTQFGIFNSRYKAVTSAGDAARSPHIVFGQGRIEQVPGLTSKYSDKVSSGSLIEWYKVNASPVSKNQITYAGYDGIDETKTLKAGCDEQYSLTVRARSNYIDAAFAYGLTRTVTVTTPCCADCSDNCESIDSRWLAVEFAKKINAEPFLSKYVVATPVLYSNPAESAPTVINTVQYSVSLCDTGNAQAQAYVQSQYPGAVVEFEGRIGSTSTYSMDLLASAGAPAALSVTQPVALAICDVCPAGYTLQPEQTLYMVERPLAGNETLVTSANRLTYANTVKAAYVAPKVFDGATAVDPATNQITVTAHGLQVNDPVVYSNGGGTTIVGLTNGATYYVQSVPNANNVTLSATKGGAVVDITADGVGAAHSLTQSATASFSKIENGTAYILISGSEGLNPITTALAGDVVYEVGTQEALCLPPAGSTVAWVATGTGYREQRTLTLTVADDCTPDLPALQALYPNYTVALVESANCNSKYSLVQTSKTITGVCGSGVPAEYDEVQGYKGLEWVESPSGYTLDEGQVSSAGVKIEGKALDVYGNPVDILQFPHEFDKLSFEVFAYKGAATSQDFIIYDRCDNIPITTVQKSTYPTGSSEEILMLETRYHSYQTTMKHIFHNATWNGGFERYSVKGQFYDTYYLTFKSPDLNTWDNVSRQDESVIIAVPAGQGAALEAFLIGYFGEEKFTAGVLIR